MIDAVKTNFGNVQVDTSREIAANKICALLSRAEIKDLVDIEALAVFGIDLGQPLTDAQRKDASVEPATLAWVLSEVSTAPGARLPGDTDPAAVHAVRLRVIEQLRALAFAQARRGSPLRGPRLASPTLRRAPRNGHPPLTAHRFACLPLADPLPRR